MVQYSIKDLVLSSFSLGKLSQDINHTPCLINKADHTVSVSQFCPISLCAIPVTKLSLNFLSIGWDLFLNDIVGLFQSNYIPGRRSNAWHHYYSIKFIHILSRKKGNLGTMAINWTLRKPMIIWNGVSYGMSSSGLAFFLSNVFRLGSVIEPEKYWVDESWFNQWLMQNRNWKLIRKLSWNKSFSSGKL